jgi:hypothetical protein
VLAGQRWTEQPEWAQILREEEERPVAFLPWLGKLLLVAALTWGALLLAYVNLVKH